MERSERVEEAPGLPARAPHLRGAAAWGVVALVAWQALASVLSIVSELTHRPSSQHLEALRSSPEELIRSSLGPDFEMWVALQRHVPAGAEVLLAPAVDDAQTKKVLTKLWALSYPITFRVRPFVPGAARRAPPIETAFEGFLLEFGPSGDFRELPAARELARGTRFRLSRFGGDGR